MTGWSVALVAATALHAGFQATVSLLVYPALARTAHVATPVQWDSAHGDHSRRITPLVVVVYGAVLVACVGALVDGHRTPGVWVALVGTAGAFLVTGSVAAPTHRRLGDGPDPRMVTRLLRADWYRLAFAVVALAGAVLEGLGGR
jgi:hypothetical protein